MFIKVLSLYGEFNKTTKSNIHEYTNFPKSLKIGIHKKVNEYSVTKKRLLYNLQERRGTKDTRGTVKLINLK